jgi:transposase
LSSTTENPLELLHQALLKETIEEEAARTFADPKEIKKTRFAMLAANGERPEAAASAVGISVPTAYRWLKDKDIAEIISKTKQQLRGAGQRQLQRLQYEAIQKVGSLMREAKKEEVQLKAALEIIDRTGLSVQELLAGEGVAAAPIVVKQFINYVESGNADKQMARARLIDPAIEGEFYEGTTGNALPSASSTNGDADSYEFEEEA